MHLGGKKKEAICDSLSEQEQKQSLNLPRPGVDLLLSLYTSEGDAWRRGVYIYNIIRKVVR